MKKWLIIFGGLAVVLGIVAFNSKIYYPPLPIDSVSKNEVINTLNKSPKGILEIAEEDEFEWFITRTEQGKERENLKQMISKKGWQFENQDGSGYFFTKGDNRLIVETEMWTKRYLIVQIPKEWKD
ncbi:hypothetical protein QWY14_02200 [Planococcus sp. N028]|uniref:Lipoprotein n=1 Tax=Planococcus shixiaomingii TaxID=3058393 RepID=A0ABT8MY73_9BACL|nr:hypothetical protein [Planococcus sp. N028]MDN7240579.1 hypothetical protein [Planococcus sp. N028]